MLDKVEILTEQGVLLTLSLQDVSSGFSVQDIEGLDPVKATLVSSTFGAMDGEQYQSARREKRNIILTLGYEPDFVSTTVLSLRKMLYTYFMPKSRVLLRFFQTGEPVYQIYGRVESLVSPKFSQEPTAVISVVCFDPDFYNPTPISRNGPTTTTSVEQNHFYPGTVETGILFKLFVNRSDLTEFTIYSRLPDGSLKSLEFSVATPLSAGEIVTISTIPGNKYVTLTRNGENLSYLYSLSPQSDWITFYPGLNRIRVVAEGASIPYTIEFTTKLGGL